MSDMSRLFSLSQLNGLLPTGAENLNDKSSLTGAEKIAATPEAEEKSAAFTEIFKGALSSVNNAQLDADEALRQVASGESKNIHETMIALQKANMSFQLMLEVRGALLEAYQEVMRTQM